MCLIGFRFDPNGQQPLLLAANRDEFLTRSTRVAGWWSDTDHIYGGRDLQAGGTWMAASLPAFDQMGSRTCRFAALTNYRDGQGSSPEQKSRGELVTQILTDSQSTPQTMTDIAARIAEYAGFNLIGFEWRQSNTDPSIQGCRGWRLCNRGREAGSVLEIAAGTHGLSNGDFNEPWPKTVALTNAFDQLELSTTADATVEATNKALLTCLKNQDRVPDEQLPSTGLPTQFERELASLFIRTSLDKQPEPVAYGTCSSAIVSLNRAGRLAFDQWTWHADSTEPLIAEHRRMESRSR